MVVPILVFIFVLFVLYRLVSRFQTNQLQIGEFFLWLVIWGIIGIVVWLPNVLDFIAIAVGVGRGVDVAIYIALVLLFYLVFRVYLKAEFLEKKVTKLVRHLAIREKEIQKHQHLPR